MPVLPPPVAPFVPVTFSPGDRISIRGDVHTRDARGLWTCSRPGCGAGLTDSQIRQAFTDPKILSVVGVPLITPAPISPGETLPGRRVAEGEDPFERDRVYLMAGTEGPSSSPFRPCPLHEPGPWGPLQRAVVLNPGPVRSLTYEMSQMETGVIWLRFPDGDGLYAYIPAQAPPVEDSAVALVAVLRAEAAR